MRTNWNIAAASVCGSGHLASGLPSQDAYLTNSPSGSMAVGSAATAPMVITVADGAGSSPYGAAGASLVAAMASDMAASGIESLDAPDLRGLANLARQVVWQTRSAVLDAVAVTRRHSLVRAKPRAFHATLQLVILYPPFLATAQIGDGFIVLQHASEKLSILASPRRHEYANVTDFVNGPHWIEPSITAWQEPQVTGIAVSSDGLEEVALEFRQREIDKAKPGFFNPLFSGVVDGSYDSARLMRLLRSPRLTDLASDDLTLVVAAAARNACDVAC